jgi:hypothetical protein
MLHIATLLRAKHDRVATLSQVASDMPTANFDVGLLSEIG